MTGKYSPNTLNSAYNDCPGTGIFSRRILEENEPDYYSGKFFFFRQTTECMRSGHFLQNY